MPPCHPHHGRPWHPAMAPSNGTTPSNSSPWHPAPTNGMSTWRSAMSPHHGTAPFPKVATTGPLPLEVRTPIALAIWGKRSQTAQWNGSATIRELTPAWTPFQQSARMWPTSVNVFAPVSLPCQRAKAETLGQSDTGESENTVLPYLHLLNISRYIKILKTCSVRLWDVKHVTAQVASHLIPPHALANLSISWFLIWHDQLSHGPWYIEINLALCCMKGSPKCVSISIVPIYFSSIILNSNCSRSGLTDAFEFTVRLCSWH